eukprot:3835491-Pleurochrysis_carterae.AAC.1
MTSGTLLTDAKKAPGRVGHACSGERGGSEEPKPEDPEGEGPTGELQRSEGPMTDGPRGDVPPESVPAFTGLGGDGTVMGECGGDARAAAMGGSGDAKKGSSSLHDSGVVQSDVWLPVDASGAAVECSCTRLCSICDTSAAQLDACLFETPQGESGEEVGRECRRAEGDCGEEGWKRRRDESGDRSRLGDVGGEDSCEACCDSCSESCCESCWDSLCDSQEAAAMCSSLSSSISSSNSSTKLEGVSSALKSSSSVTADKASTSFLSRGLTSVQCAIAHLPTSSSVLS